METCRVERVNPTSEKPKFGRGAGGCEYEADAGHRNV